MVGIREGCIKFGPKSTLALLMCTMLLLSSDKGAVSGVLKDIQEEFSISSLQAGLLGSSFVLGYILMSPLSAQLSQYYHPFNIIFASLVIYLISVIGCIFSYNYYTLLIFRALTGAGDGGILALGSPIIIAIAPTHSKSLWLALLYVSNAIGGVSGIASSSVLYSHTGNWRFIFIIEAIAIVPFMILVFTAYKDPSLLKKRPTENVIPYKTQMKELLNNPVFLLVCFSYAAKMFMVGGFFFWAPTIIHELFGLSVVQASSAIGAIAGSTAIFGSALGSILFDRYFKKKSQTFGEISEREKDLLKCREACKVMFICSCIGSCFGAVGAFSENVVLFLGGFGLMCFFFFCNIGNVSVAFLTAVRSRLREQANALNNITFRVLGDLPAPFIIGAIIEAYGYRWGAIVGILWAFFGVLAIGPAYCISVFAI